MNDRPRDAPGPAPGTPKSPVDRAVQEYAEEYPQLQALTAQWLDRVTTLLDDAGINYLSVTGRTKSVASFATKANRFALRGQSVEEITDRVGIRVITYLLSDVTAVADLLYDQFAILDDRDMGLLTASEGRFGYSSRHMLVELKRSRRRTPGVPASIQVRTALQHVWAEFEHDIRYKGTVPEEHVPDLDRRFTLAAGLLELADREFSEIRARIQAATPRRADDEDPGDPRISSRDLAAFLSAEYADAGWSRTDHYAWISGLLLELGITSLAELAGLLTSVDSHAIDARLAYKYPPGAVRRLDDALLAVFGQRYVDLHGNAHRTELLAARLEKLRDDQPAGADPA